MGGFLGAPSVGRILNGLAPDAPRTRRGAQEQKIFRDVSPGVVYIETEMSAGSGTLISAQGEILTNWHVVESAGEILVGFLPDSGFDLNEAKVFTAKIIRYDQVADLALLKLAESFPESANVIILGAPDSISIGSDVHAIGHPTGEAWTYTKGYVSQIRGDYEWVTDSGLLHRADVVQTQTPINPGNSGGPLIDNSGTVVGVNSFGAEGEGLNFAVSVSEVQEFLERTESRDAPHVANAGYVADECQALLLDVVRSEEDDANIEVVDLDCNGTPDLYMFEPDVLSEPIFILLDLNENGVEDAIIQDEDRDGRWDSSFWDEDEDGEYEYCGVHADGEMQPSSYEAC